MSKENFLMGMARTLCSDWKAIWYACDVVCEQLYMVETLEWRHGGAEGEGQSEAIFAMPPPPCTRFLDISRLLNAVQCFKLIFT